MKCVICQNESVIVIKTIFFCETCFQNKFFQKIRRVLKNLKDKNVLLVLSGSRDSLVLAYFIDKIFLNRKNTKIHLFCPEFNRFIDFFENLCFQKINFQIPKISNENEDYFCTNYIRRLLSMLNENIEGSEKIRSVIIEENLNESAAILFDFICNGKGRDACNYARGQIDDLIFIKPLSDIFNYEIDHYYLSLKNIVPLSAIQIKRSNIYEMSANFIDSLTKDNYSTPYNIIETLKKVPK
ncbi:hypothetical protein EDEG_03790 [Edhazardia aedis USNM 41457]|uniref:Cytoplasmic tRNA 2-thiolation protein 2 n=1 Tax=Edhazardia aedis (strain USNM 41457) TaxID=1003232 RepID=J8ZPQ4_EDHAE|nr:hypothetical protein EDEG_03790 [Edhazardia aedis USNM 41457]|eukprot:EJW01668.1 hypothetical protein EDEG_03790 [Edhazardia aedis USNM 41457]